MTGRRTRVSGHVQSRQSEAADRPMYAGVMAGISWYCPGMPGILAYTNQHIQVLTNYAVLENSFISSNRDKKDHETVQSRHYTIQYKNICFALCTITSSSAIAERPRCRVGYLWPKVEDCKLETTLYWHYRSGFNHNDVIGQQSNRIRWENANKAIMPLKVIQGHRGRYQSKARMRFPISD